MKRIFLSTVLGIALVASSSAFAASQGSKWTESQKLSYIFGTRIGEVSKDNDVALDMKLVNQGINDVIKGNKRALDKDEIRSSMATFQKKVMAKRKADLEAERKANAEEGRKFLEANKKKKGVKVTASGLQYRVIKQGKGPKPTASDRVRVQYRGKLIDGAEFDSSYKRKKPAEFALKQVIKGWTEGLQLMPEGSTYEFYIPAELAYGKNGPPVIGPNRTLIFEVTLLKVLK
jgi:FKBP-type peptidyl-prolyl cis-trans isomerase